MNKRYTLLFDLAHPVEGTAFANMVRNFNETGVPYETFQSGTVITFEFSTGY